MIKKHVSKIFKKNDPMILTFMFTFMTLLQYVDSNRDYARDQFGKSVEHKERMMKELAIEGSITNELSFGMGKYPDDELYYHYCDVKLAIKKRVRLALISIYHDREFDEIPEFYPSNWQTTVPVYPPDGGHTFRLIIPEEIVKLQSDDHLLFEFTFFIHDFVPSIDSKLWKYDNKLKLYVRARDPRPF